MTTTTPLSKNAFRAFHDVKALAQIRGSPP
jgi:hypothetical protein